MMVEQGGPFDVLAVDMNDHMDKLPRLLSVASPLLRQGATVVLTLKLFTNYKHTATP
eukprot:CAMPEP_0175881366 /NCGR_PEP_ID=MMETSP0107_2-20121207/42833_1 /TAXON_ID=195067 ORGANISM="Goniomonas pacifica, Strain CCMP1869" /NCGR_SAMPLE_ID=MMETSP0107_2 /ASSEMBLY_ACC=CAM_ASM_000203 /LENGTH=56 /DNA_ID=CAMNT_0017201213 /DNA_START=1 /DNA_END=167 /DNA_ORIENTATION=+